MTFLDLMHFFDFLELLLQRFDIIERFLSPSRACFFLFACLSSFFSLLLFRFFFLDFRLFGFFLFRFLLLHFLFRLHLFNFIFSLLECLFSLLHFLFRGRWGRWFFIVGYLLDFFGSSFSTINIFRSRLRFYLFQGGWLNDFITFIGRSRRCTFSIIFLSKVLHICMLTKGNSLDILDGNHAQKSRYN